MKLGKWTKDCCKLSGLYSLGKQEKSCHRLWKMSWRKGRTEARNLLGLTKAMTTAEGMGLRRKVEAWETFKEIKKGWSCFKPGCYHLTYLLFLGLFYLPWVYHNFKLHDHLGCSMFVARKIKFFEGTKNKLFKFFPGHLGGSGVKRLPLAQGMILESQDQVPHWAPCMEPASPSTCVSASLSLCLPWINK